MPIGMLTFIGYEVDSVESLASLCGCVFWVLTKRVAR